MGISLLDFESQIQLYHQKGLLFDELQELTRRNPNSHLLPEICTYIAVNQPILISSLKWSTKKEKLVAIFPSGPRKDHFPEIKQFVSVIRNPVINEVSNIHSTCTQKMTTGFNITVKLFLDDVKVILCV